MRRVWGGTNELTGESVMSFSAQRAVLAADMERLGAALRDALVVTRALEKHAAGAVGETETLGDDALLARVASTARKARQELTALTRLIQETTNSV